MVLPSVRSLRRVFSFALRRGCPILLHGFLYSSGGSGRAGRDGDSPDSFVFSVKKGVLAIFGECNAYLDDAIEGNLRPPKDEETELALFEVKLSRFVHLQQKAFQDANVQKAQIEALLSDISHQTKTPIANILLYSQLLREKSGENREIVERLVQQSEKLKFLIQTLVEMSRLENGIIKCVPRQENVREFCIQVIGDFYEKAQEKNLDVRLECQNGSPLF